MVSLDWVLPMMLFKYCMSHVHAFFMHTFFFPCNLVVMCSLSWIDCAMAPKARKSTPTWSPLGSGSSSFDPIPPLHVRFCDEKARKDFLEKFQKRGVHPKRHVILSNFSDTPLLTAIRTRG